MKKRARDGTPIEQHPRELEPPLTVVGVGASAGGLEAFTRFLQALPVDTGMAFVLVQHLSPDRESGLAGLLSRATRMPVTEVSDEPELEANRVYVIPPDRNMVLVGGHLELFRLDEKRPHHPIDRFFHSLAESRDRMSVGVVLSGSATDGTLGLEAIKAAGGLTFAQDDSARFGSMPLNAVASGCVDFVMRPEDIARELAYIATHPLLAPGNGRGPPDASSKAALAPILRLVGENLGADLGPYRNATLSRRIHRRMLLSKKTDLDEYERLLRARALELELLSRDILIGVTGFFRDPEVFDELKARVLPGLIEARSPDAPIRVWVPGCSTGEEAYSLAMIVAETMTERIGQVSAQIFATDLSDDAIAHARGGSYANERMHGVSAARRNRFFVEKSGRFQVSKSLRDSCIFSRHDVLADPPFSRMDLVCCRNLLIYLEAPFQQQLIRHFHYALKPSGVLVLGTSETVGALGDLFEPGAAGQKIFAKRSATVRSLAFPTRGRTDSAIGAPVLRVRTATRGTPPASATAVARADVQTATDRLLAELAPPAVLVDGNLEILQFRGDTEPYLAPPHGPASLSVLKMARNGLLVPLRTLLHKAKGEGAPVREEGVRVRAGDSERVLTLEVLPVQANPVLEGCFLVVFKDPVATAGERGREPRRRKRRKSLEQDSSPAIIARLEQELDSSRRHLRALMEQHDAADVELQSANEELQSANEEQQSINEELETSKEEIQSSNEELNTVNEELAVRNEELTHLNSDLHNLIDSVEIPIVIIGRDLRIRRFSPLAEQIFRTVPADTGRPITDIKMPIEVADLEGLLAEVIQTATPVEREVQTKDGRWHSLRIRPYMTADNTVDGAVLMLVDVHDLRRAREYAENIVEMASVPLLILDESMRVRSANHAFHETFNARAEKLDGVPLYEIDGGCWDVPRLRELFDAALTEQDAIGGVFVEIRGQGDRPRIVQMNARCLVAPGEDRVSILLAIEDVTDQQALTDALRSDNADLTAADTARNQFLVVLSHELRSPLSAISAWTRIMQRGSMDADEIEKALAIVDRNARALARLIEELLDVHRITSGTVALEMAALDLVALVRLAVEVHGPAAAERRVRLELYGDLSTAVVSGDSNRLQQVLANLLGNAIKFTPAGGRVRVDARLAAGNVEVRVEDTGEGIAPAVLPHLFDRSHPLAPFSRGKGGLGLGLSISKQLVELHGGTLSASSSGRGKGATFRLSFPPLTVEDGDGDALERSGGDVAPQPLPLAGRSVLVVAGAADAREALRRSLENAGCETFVSGSVDEALAAMDRRLPDVIVSDLDGPAGCALISAVRARSSETGGRVPAITLTDYPSAEARERALRAGFERHLPKPVEPARLLATAALVYQHATTGADRA